MLLALPSFAQDFEYNGIWYTVLDEEAKTCQTKWGPWSEGFDGPNINVKGDIEIPSTVSDGVNNYTVIGIGNGSFQNCKTITSIKIPDSVQYIGYWAFYSCTSLCSISLPNSLSKIFEHAFGQCSSLTSVNIPEAVTVIDLGVFGGCSSLTSITIPDSVTIIEHAAFSTCRSLISINLPNSLTDIEEYAFHGCWSLSSIKIPDSVKTIKGHAFEDCSSLTSVYIPKSVSFIGYLAFIYCPQLSSIYYYSEEPIEADEPDIFGTNTYNNATLYVLESALSKAQSTTPWNLFANIVGTADVDGLQSESNDPVEVYSLEGVKISNNTDALPSGIYIKREGKEVKKIKIN